MQAQLTARDHDVAALQDTVVSQAATIAIHEATIEGNEVTIAALKDSVAKAFLDAAAEARAADA